MAPILSLSSTWSAIVICALGLASTISPLARAEDSYYISGTDAAGVTRELLNDRNPALYTGDFGDCLGGESLLNVTRFDAAYYADNMTVLFHLDATTNVKNESVMSAYFIPSLRESLG